MTRSQRDFFTPHQTKGRPATSRFGLRREPETKKPKPDKSTFSYGSPGRGQSGESSN